MSLFIYMETYIYHELFRDCINQKINKSGIAIAFILTIFCRWSCMFNTLYYLPTMLNNLLVTSIDITQSRPYMIITMYNEL